MRIDGSMRASRPKPVFSVGGGLQRDLASSTAIARIPNSMHPEHVEGWLPTPKQCRSISDQWSLPSTRNAFLYPIVAIKCCVSGLNTTPPIPEPDTAIPVAKPRRL